MTSFFDTLYGSTRVEITLVALLVLVIYYIYYRLKHHEKMHLIEHPYYIALWVTVLLNILAIVIFSLLPIEYTEEIDDIVHKVILALSIGNFYAWREISLQKTGKK